MQMGVIDSKKMGTVGEYGGWTGDHKGTPP